MIPIMKEDSGMLLIHIQGHENKVKENLEKRVESMGLQNILFNIAIPEHVETEIKNGKKRTRQ